MRVLEVAPRRRGLALVRFAPAPPQNMAGAAYEKEQLLLDRVILARCEIRPDQELSEAELKELVLVSESYRAKQRAIWFLSQGDLSERALYDKLCRSFTERAAAFAVGQMVEKGYVNDRNYAVLLIAKGREKQLSRRAIQNQLFLKGVPAAIANEALQAATLEETEADRATVLLKTKYKNKINTEEEIRKTVAALARRGFSYSDIKTALDRIQVACEGENNGI